MTITMVDPVSGKAVDTIELKSFKPWEDEGITEEEYLARETAIFCECENVDVKYVDYADIKGIGRINKHGWLCRKCGKYVQVG